MFLLNVVKHVAVILLLCLTWNKARYHSDACEAENMSELQTC